MCNVRLMFVSEDELCTKHLGRTYIKILSRDRFLSIKKEFVLRILSPLTLWSGDEPPALGLCWPVLQKSYTRLI